MGYASPQTGFTGYILSDDILDQDTTTYTENGLIYVTKITGYALSDVHKKSKLRFKVSIENDDNITPGQTDVRLLVNSTLIWEDSTFGTGWVEKTFNTNVSWRRGNIFEVQLRAVVAGQARMKDFKICGKVSPIRIG